MNTTAAGPLTSAVPMCLGPSGRAQRLNKPLELAIPIVTCNPFLPSPNPSETCIIHLGHSSATVQCWGPVLTWFTVQWSKSTGQAHAKTPESSSFLTWKPGAGDGTSRRWREWPGPVEGCTRPLWPEDGGLGQRSTVSQHKDEPQRKPQVTTEIQ